jgi:hypothetical protein
MSMDWDDFWELGEEPVDIAFPDDTNFDKVPYMIVMYELDPLTEIPEAPEPVEMCMGANATARACCSARFRSSRYRSWNDAIV